MTLILEILRLLLRKTTEKPTNTQSNQYQREQQKSILKNNFHQFTQKNNFLPCLSSSSISIFSFAATAWFKKNHFIYIKAKQKFIDSLMRWKET